MGEAASSPSLQDAAPVHLHDVDELNHAVSGSNLELLQLKSGRFDATLTQVSVGDFSLDQGTTNLPLRVSGCLDRQRFGVGIFHAGARATWNGNHVDTSQLLFYAPGRELNGFVSAGYAWTSLVIPPDWMESIAQTAWRSNMLQMRSDCRMTRPAPSKLADVWHAVAPLAASAKASVRTLACADWLTADLRNSLGATLSALDVPPVKAMSRALAHFSTARRAERYMRERMAEPLCIDDICVVLRVSRRYLEYAFTDAFGTSPSRYLRLLRLHQVRRRLKSVGDETTVTDEAIRFGFNHLSLFSLQYEKVFGESPSITRASSAR
jgi:AraC family transcriptional regulator, ethanolamine operon transcriptional activator